MSEEVKNHYWMVHGIVMFKDEDGDGVARMDINAVFMAAQMERGILEIQKTQQMLQVQCFNRLGAPVEVVGVTICTYNYLGAMSDEQYNNIPPADLGVEVPDQVN